MTARSIIESFTRDRFSRLDMFGIALCVGIAAALDVGLLATLVIILVGAAITGFITGFIRTLAGLDVKTRRATRG